MAARNKIVKAYLDAYRKLVSGQVVRDIAAHGQSVTISVPLHVSANHRVEVTATEISANRFVLSDMGRTLGELGDYGYKVTADFRRRATEIAKELGIHIVDDYLVLECGTADLGISIQTFSEAAKTIGDAYLLQRTRTVHARTIVADIKRIFD